MSVDNSASKNAGWEESLLDVFREVVNKLPEETSLGELVKATRANPHIAPVLQLLSVQELIDLAATRPEPTSTPTDATDESAADDAPAVIRRRADVPNGDTLLLGVLAERGPLGETQLARAAKLSSEQTRLIIRQLSARNLVHAEGSGTKRRFRITRAGNGQLRRNRGRS